MSEILVTWTDGVENSISLLALVHGVENSKSLLALIQCSDSISFDLNDPPHHPRRRRLLGFLIVHGPVIFPFFTDYEKMYLVQWFLHAGIFQDRLLDDDPRYAPMIEFAMLCKETYLKGNVMPKPMSDGELDVIPRVVRGDWRRVRNPTRRETISMLQDLHRLGCKKRRLTSWLDPINRTVRRIFILACRKNQIKFVGGDILSHILCHLWKAV